MESSAAARSTAPDVAAGSGSGALESLWLETLRRLFDRAAHEVKGALNGVALNVEVVRSRAERPDTPASAVASYANATSAQLDAVIAMTEALLALGRRAKTPVELASVVRQTAALLGPAIRSDGGSFELGSLADLGATTAAPDAARLAIGASLLAVSARAGSVRCASTGGVGDGANPALRIECDGDSVTVAPEIVAAVGEAGVRISSDAGGILISFPR